jgi:hypothetical protein
VGGVGQSSSKIVRRWQWRRGGLGVVAVVLGITMLGGILGGAAADSVRDMGEHAYLLPLGLLVIGAINVLRGWQPSCTACGAHLIEHRGFPDERTLQPLIAALSRGVLDRHAAAMALASKSPSPAGEATFEYCSKCFAVGEVVGAMGAGRPLRVELASDELRSFALEVAEAKLAALRRGA